LTTFLNITFLFTNFLKINMIREYIKMDFTRTVQGNITVNHDLEGDQKDCPKGNENETTIARDENNEDTRRVSVMESKRRRFT
jgi:hypothetical protein